MENILFQYEVNPATWIYLSSLMVLCIYFKFTRLWSLRNLDLFLLIALAPGVLLVEHARLLNIEYQPALAQVGYGLLFFTGFLLLIRLLLDPGMIRRPLLEPNMTTGGLTFMGSALLVFLTANTVVHDVSPESTIGSQQLDQMLSRQELPVEQSHLNQFGPIYGWLHLVGRLPNAILIPTDEDSSPAEQTAMMHRATARTMSILAHLAIVIGMVVLGYLHFDNMRTGIATAALYLLLPYTSYLVGQPEMSVPSALLIWALVAYRRPFVSGLLVGMSAGCIYYPLFLLPLWIGFYRQRGAARFLGGFSIPVVISLLSLILVSSSAGAYAQHMLEMVSWLSVYTGLPKGFWQSHSPAYRIPMLVAFLALTFSFSLWPAQKNLGTLMSCSACVMLGTQFWHAQQGGLCIGWYMPLLLLTIFRPNLEDRVALRVLDESWMTRHFMNWRSFQAAA